MIAHIIQVCIGPAVAQSADTNVATSGSPDVSTESGGSRTMNPDMSPGSSPGPEHPVVL